MGIKTNEDVARKMLANIREMQEGANNPGNGNEPVAIKANDQKFGDVRRSQEQAIIKTIGNNVSFGDNALVFYPDPDNVAYDLVLNGTIPSLNTKFQFRFNDDTGDGCYVWANGLRLTETNTRSIGKLHDAFENWKTSLIQQSDLLAKMNQELSR